MNNLTRIIKTFTIKKKKRVENIHVGPTFEAMAGRLNEELHK